MCNKILGNKSKSIKLLNDQLKENITSCQLKISYVVGLPKDIA